MTPPIVWKLWSTERLTDKSWMFIAQFCLLLSRNMNFPAYLRILSPSVGAENKTYFKITRVLLNINVREKRLKKARRDRINTESEPTAETVRFKLNEMKKPNIINFKNNRFTLRNVLYVYPSKHNSFPGDFIIPYKTTNFIWFNHVTSASLIWFGSKNLNCHYFQLGLFRRRVQPVGSVDRCMRPPLMNNFIV